MNNDLLTDAEVADLLGIKPQTLRMWRMRGFGPKFLKFGISGKQGNVRYRRATVEAWLDEQERQSTAQESAA